MKSKNPGRLAGLISIFLICMPNLSYQSQFTTAMVDPQRRGWDLGAHTQATNYCQRFLSTNYKDIDNGVGDPSSLYSKNCYDPIKRYFDQYKEEDLWVSKYVDTCKSVNITPLQCSEFILSISQSGWGMSKACDILQHISIARFFGHNKRYEHINVSPNDWFDFKFGNFNLASCVEDFVRNNKNTEIVAQLNGFKNWWSTNDRNNEGHYSCSDVIGVNTIVIAKREAHMDNGVTPEDFYNSIFLNPRFLSNLWKKEQYKGIAHTAKRFDKKTITSFITVGHEIARANWWNKNPNSRWLFEFMADFSDLEKGEFQSPEFNYKIKLMAIAIKYGFSRETFEEFIAIPDKVGDEFSTDECKVMILKSVFTRIKREDLLRLPREIHYNQQSFFYNNYMFWEKNDKKLFNAHISLLLDIYKKNHKRSLTDIATSITKNSSTLLQRESSCSDFVTRLYKIEKVFYSSHWSQSELTTFITGGHEKGKDLLETYKCLKYKLLAS